MKRNCASLLFCWLGVLALGISGCVARTRRVKESDRPKPAQTASHAALIQEVNARLAVTASFQAKVRFDLRSGSVASGELKNYHEIKGFILYRRPDHIRMIGQIPTFGVNALDMISNGREFRVSFAPYKKFIVGSALDQPRSKKPLENLRPAHILQAFAIAPIASEDERHIQFIEELREGRDNFYVIYEAEREDSQPTRLRRKLWIDRYDLTVARQQLFSEDGVLESEIHFAGSLTAGEARLAQSIDLWRPREDYGLKIYFDEIRFNLSLEDSKFELSQPPGYELVEIGKSPTTP